MRRFFICLTVILTVFSSFCFATEEDYNVEEGKDGAIPIDDYDDFYDAYNGSGSQSELKEYYREYLSYSRDQDALNTEEAPVKAKVVDVSQKKTTYGMDYYNPYKITYQPIKVEVLEGDYAGKVFDIQYVLTADTYENLNMSEVNIGDKIFITIKNDSEDGIQGYTARYDTRVYKAPKILALIVVAGAIIIIFAKTKGFKTLLLIALIFDLVFVITLPIMIKSNEIVTLQATDAGFPTIEQIDGDDSIAILEVDDAGQPTVVEVVKKSNSFIWLILLDVLLISSVCLINKLGLTRKTVIAFCITICTLILVAILASGVNLLTSMNGNTFEATWTTENIVNKNIDFNAIYMLSVLVIASVVISNVVAKVLMTYDTENYREIINEFLLNQVETITVISLLLLFSKVMALMIFKYSFIDLINSEMILNEVVRMLLLIIFIPIVAFATEKCEKNIKNL